MVALPVAVGVLLNTLVPGVVALIAPLCPLFAVLAVSLICSSVIASSSSAILGGGLTVIVAVLLLHTAGFSMGFVLAKLLGFSASTARTISIEVRCGRSLCRFLGFRKG
jgi:BASS family bile acid:Na+ symporter